ncbi:hypothetical protein [Ruegeria arenilitoris]|uniref:hypothetical protein n=1 Tax=Ruegeria arenilitoris TaxID=1173585 RepID=UPI0014813571|nr:hypothetical protein [Ruegeria arenilitoris]
MLFKNGIIGNRTTKEIVLTAAQSYYGDAMKRLCVMDEESEERIIQALTLRARGGDADAARILFNEKAKRVRPVRFHECQTLDELKHEFENYMGMPDITRAESEHATKAFDRLFKLITTRDEQKHRLESDLALGAGMIIVPLTDTAQWEALAEQSQRDLKVFARN